jgi:hypothetical protein
MSNRKISPTGAALEESMAASVNDIDLSEILAAARIEYGWTSSESKAVARLYRNHLWLCQKYPDEHLAPATKKADLLWHIHILHTEKYAADCQRAFGRFLHHRPSPDASLSREREIIANRTRELYEREFHQPLSARRKVQNCIA